MLFLREIVLEHGEGGNGRIQGSAEVVASGLHFPQSWQLIRITYFHPETAGNGDRAGVGESRLYRARLLRLFRAVVIVGGFDVGDSANTGRRMAHLPVR